MNTIVFLADRKPRPRPVWSESEVFASLHRNVGFCGDHAQSEASSHTGLCVHLSGRSGNSVSVIDKLVRGKHYETRNPGPCLDPLLDPISKCPRSQSAAPRDALFTFLSAFCIRTT